MSTATAASIDFTAATCQKCGATGLNAKWHMPRRGQSVFASPIFCGRAEVEHFCLTCRVCGYVSPAVNAGTDEVTSPLNPSPAVR